MRKLIRALLLSPAVLAGIAPLLALSAQAPARPAKLELPLIEVPYNLTDGVRAPGMQQSLGLTTSFYEATHTLLGRVAPSHSKLNKFGTVVFDYFTMAVPFGDAWVHEEWHRAVLGHNGIGSYNEVWNVKNIFAEAISVSHVSDDDLVRLKRERPRDFVRTKAAGYEGEGELITRLESNQFFRDSKAWHQGLYWLVMLNDAFYVGLVTSPTDSAMVDDMTDDANREEKTIAQRDISGHDFTAWVYHLFRDNEPFEARGPHPSGVGLNRYIKVADLTAEEKSFLAREGKLTWLNFLDPNLYGRHRFDIRNPFNGGRASANAWLRHSLTSFGHTIDAHVVLRQGDVGLHAIAQRFTNHERSFPGMRLEMVEYPMSVGSHELLVSPRLGAWAQPRDQAFRTRDASIGGLAGLRVESAGDSRLHVYADVEMKSAGWVAGRTNLGRGATILTGLTYSLTRGKN
jgi:hypothetical protein